MSSKRQQEAKSIGRPTALQQAVGAVLLGGMFVSTLVTLVLVPLLLGLCFRLLPATDVLPIS